MGLQAQAVEKDLELLNCWDGTFAYTTAKVEYTFESSPLIKIKL